MTSKRNDETAALKIELAQERQKLVEAEAEVKQLTRDNKVLKRKAESMEEQSDKKKTQLEKEVGMRVKANREKYELEQKMADMQKKMHSTLERYNIDLTKSQTLEEALTAALEAMQRMSEELSEKENLAAGLKIQQSNADKLSKERDQLKDQVVILETLWKTKEEVLNGIFAQHNDILKKRKQIEQEFFKAQQAMSTFFPQPLQESLITIGSDKMNENEQKTTE